jgi:hypothetical protein
MLDEERDAFGSAYQDGGWLFVWPNSSRPHPDSVTDRFNRLVDAARETVTQRIYTHRSTGRDQAAADLIGGMIREELGDAPEESKPEAC